MRDEELGFLGMKRKTKTKDEMANDPIEKMKKIQDERKLVQQLYSEEFKTAKEELKLEIDENEGLDIKEQMLKERRDWIH